MIYACDSGYSPVYLCWKQNSLLDTNFPSKGAKIFQKLGRYHTVKRGNSVDISTINRGYIFEQMSGDSFYFGLIVIMVFTLKPLKQCYCTQLQFEIDTQDILDVGLAYNSVTQ